VRAVNLLPRDAIRERKAFSQENAPVLVAAGLGVVVTGALALGFLHETSSLSAAQRELQAAKQQLVRTPRPVEVAVKPDPNAALAGQQSARLSAVTTAVGARVAWDRILREFSLVLPDDITLTSLNLKMPDPTAVTVAGGAPAQDFVISGTTYSHDSVARLLARLALIPELSQVSLQSDTASPTGAAGSSGSSSLAGPISFQINAAITLPPGTPSLNAPPPPTPPPVSDTSTDGTSS
jgi:Tfp pilus assembly protein PilN